MSAWRRSVGTATALTSALILFCVFALLVGTASASKRTTIKRQMAPPPGLALGIDDTAFRSSSTAQQALSESLKLGASYVRVVVDWSGVAPDGASRPGGFDPRSPADPQYNWTGIDGQVRRAVNAGLTPYFTLLNAPRWAQDGTPPASALAGGGAWKPSAAEFGHFSHAAAVRYSGTYSDATSGGILPGVSVWQAWNEPNLPLFLAPTSPELYRGLLNSMHDEVKAVQPSSTVVTAGLAPVKPSTPAAFPKDFAMQLLCLKPSNGWFEKDRTCPAPAKFDVLSLHPYSLKAKPTQRAAVAGNMFVADTVDLAQMLKASSAHNAVSPGAKRLWVTEFAWFTTPSNTSVGDDPEVAARRTTIALYTLWHAGVSQITWFALSDNSGAIIKGGGLFDASGRAKPTYYAVRFPFFVRQEGRKLLIWGRSPVQSSRLVSIKILRGGNAKRVTLIRPAKGGIFQKRMTLKSSRAGNYVAQQGSERSRSFNSRDYFR